MFGNVRTLEVRLAAELPIGIGRVVDGDPLAG
jgi:hypothetical protein